MYWHAIPLSGNILNTSYAMQMKTITLQTYVRKLVTKEVMLLTANSAVNPFRHSTSCYPQQFYNPIKAARKVPYQRTVQVQGAERLNPPGSQYLHELKKKDTILPTSHLPHNQQILLKARIANTSCTLLTRRKLIKTNSNEIYTDPFRIIMALNIKFKFCY